MTRPALTRLDMRLPASAALAAAITIALLLASSAAAARAQTGAAGPQFGSSAAGAGAGGGGGSASSAKSTSAGGVVAVPEDFSRLKIQPGFQLDVQLFDEPDFSGTFRVLPDGNVMLPFLGPIRVAGDTQAEAQQKIQDALKTAQLFKNPQVTLDVTQYAPTLISVLGEVNSPGRLQMLAPHSLLDVLSFAGGETQLAGGEIEVRHEVDGKSETATYHYGRNSNGDSIASAMVQNGDTVIVPRAGIVYVLGQVTRPGGFLMQEDGKLDAAQAISMAFGTTLLASTRHILIIRRKPDGTFISFEVSYNAMVHGKVTPPQLQPQDIVYVPNSRLKTAFTDVQGVITATGTAAIYRTLE
jgi:polysaccharide export outer membrane protein